MALSNDPAYKAQMASGVEAIDRSAASRSMLNSGGTLKGLNRFGQNLADQSMDSILNRNNILAGYGLNAAQANATVGTAATGGINNTLLQSTLGRSSAYQQKGQTNSDLYGGLGGAAGELVGGLFGNKGGQYPGYTGGYFGGGNPLTDPNQLAGLF
jgi:hypothetical protein